MSYSPRIAKWPTEFADKLPVVEIFYSLQGEGRFSGTPAVFIRLKYCNLGCAWCDTRFTWDEQKIDKGDLLDAGEIVTRAIATLRGAVSHLDRIHVVLTGGEPMLHQDRLPVLIAKLRAAGFTFVEIETNGTYAPTPDLIAAIDWWNCSPKLGNNLLDPEAQIVPDALRVIAATGKADFKFVIQAPQEVREVIDGFSALFPADRIVIMPEGQTCARQLNAMSELVDVCLEHGFRLSPRLHTLIWDNERGR